MNEEGILIIRRRFDEQDFIVSLNNEEIIIKLELIDNEGIKEIQIGKGITIRLKPSKKLATKR